MLSFVESLFSLGRQDEYLGIETESPSGLTLRCGRAQHVFDRLSRAVTRNGKLESTLLPERRSYWVQQQSLAEASLGVSWTRDLLVTMGEDLGNGAWSLRVQVRPLMRFVWLGAIFMALGGLLSTVDKRYRRRAEAVQPAAQSGVTSPSQSPA
jgi:cytochrome c-type biogenesis protein CcmF